jgi:hypothetical protein
MQLGVDSALRFKCHAGNLGLNQEPSGYPPTGATRAWRAAEIQVFSLRSALMFRGCLVLCVVALASGVVPAQAGVVGYFFFEGSDGPHPGQEGAVLLFSSPPAESNAGWTLSNVADIADFRILDSSLGTVGVYTPGLITPSISSNTGATLDSGQISGGLPPSAYIVADFDSSPGQSLIDNIVTGASSHGDWRVAVGAAVPEPSSMTMAATALSAGVMLWMRRRRRSYGETGPADINRH